MRAIIEMSQGSSYKMEINKITGQLMLDRPVLRKIPHNYGYFPNTLENDGDCLDLFCFAWEPLPPLVSVEVDIVGAIMGLDNGVQDNKILAYVKGDTKSDVDWFTNECLSYLRNYKEGYVVDKVVGADEAMTILQLATIIHPGVV